MRAGVLGVTVGLLACSPKVQDSFVVGGAEITRWEDTSDGKLRVPLVAGLTWDPPQSPPGTLLRVGAREGPTVVLASEVLDAPSPLALFTCATAHAQRIVTMASKSGLVMTSPVVDEEKRQGRAVPHVHYAVGLDAKGSGRPASLMSSWTYVLSAGRCVAVGVSAVVRAKLDDATAPDPEDLNRFHRVYAALADGTHAL